MKLKPLKAFKSKSRPDAYKRAVDANDITIVLTINRVALQALQTSKN